MHEWTEPAARAALAGSIERELGLNFGESRLDDLWRGVAAVARRQGGRSASDLAARIVDGRASGAEWSALADALAVGETYFFREPEFFRYLAQDILPALVAAKRADGSRSIRIWSVGCSSGEEPCSIAMMLAGLLPDRRDWNVCVLGTDLRSAALEKARAGVYGRWSLRGPIPDVAEPFLRRGGDGKVKVDDTILRMVRYEQLNLARDAYPSAQTGTLAMDLVVCRNVLMYFAPARARAIAERLARCVADRGWLLTNPIEIPAGGIPGLEPLPDSGFTAFRRIARAPATPLALPAAAQAALQLPPVPRSEAAEEPLPEELARRAHALAGAGDLEGAESLCQAAIRRDSFNPHWSYLLGSILQERGSLGEAEAALRRTLYLEREHVLGRFALGALMSRRGDAARAQQHFALALDRLSQLPQGEVLPWGGGVTASELAAAIHRVMERAA